MSVCLADLILLCICAAMFIVLLVKIRRMQIEAEREWRDLLKKYGLLKEDSDEQRTEE